MVQDTIQNSQKKLRESDDIVKSLILWRDKIYEQVKGKPVKGPDDLFLVINQILYRG